MKNLLLAIVLVFTSSLQIHASTISDKGLLDFVQNQKTIILNLSLINVDVNQITITDADGEIVFNEKVSKYKNGVKYNLSTLPVGTYTILLEGDDIVDTYTTTITEEEVLFKNREYHTRPNITVLNKAVQIDMHFANSENIHVEIYDLAGELIFDFKDSKQGNFNKIFNLEKLEIGDYKIVVSTEYFSSASTITL
ncbi:MAG: hypothetical protein R3279_02140 [Putridiphycobacter sp.]|nr:hypothetical protein [Putridiphycobacter sp.]